MAEEAGTDATAVGQPTPVIKVAKLWIAIALILISTITVIMEVLRAVVETQVNIKEEFRKWYCARQQME